MNIRRATAGVAPTLTMWGVGDTVVEKGIIGDLTDNPFFVYLKERTLYDMYTKLTFFIS